MADNAKRGRPALAVAHQRQLPERLGGQLFPVRQRRTTAGRAGHSDYLTRPLGRRQLTPEGGQYAGSDTGRDGREGVRVVAKVSGAPAPARHRGRPRGGGGDWPWPAAFL